MTKNSLEINIKLSCDNKQIKDIKITRYLGSDIDIDSSLSLKDQMMN